MNEYEVRRAAVSLALEWAALRGLDSVETAKELVADAKIIAEFITGWGDSKIIEAARNLAEMVNSK